MGRRTCGGQSELQPCWRGGKRRILSVESPDQPNRRRSSLRLSSSLPGGVRRRDRAAHARDADRPQHLAADDFDVLVVDGNGLRAVDLLDLVDQVALQLHTENGQNVVRVDRTLLAAASIAFSGSPARTRSPSCTLTWTERGTEYSRRATNEERSSDPEVRLSLVYPAVAHGRRLVMKDAPPG